ncbi:multidrug ABC transporter substrate-binding protein [Bdellovibrio bacteriovorus]|uniref:Multidrug ABC transporter substrate-binding protein n=1 Tax=Bdellovibrio bacteriovorus TaxID=959 RepID=A0A150WK04_BDEBC|nr:MlaD family protein [Bdellovibrio bacteriovorus]KYG64117.1 multidrug ABC transporter substrate-binding protein [Bdellovibrio bacteriovorus]
MINLKFNKFERVAGMFILVAVAGVLLTGLSAAIRQGWFEPRVRYKTMFLSADGIHQGTVVQLSGLKVGAVESVELESDNRVSVEFYILGKFQDRVREDSSAQLVRPFIIGERVLDLSMGTEDFNIIPAGGHVKSTETMDLMTLMSGKNMNSYLAKLGGILESMQVIMDAFADKSRAESLVRVIDRLDPLMKNLNTMSSEVIKLSRQATHGDGMQKLVGNLNSTTSEINRILPELNEQNPDLAKDLATMTQNLAVVTKALGPATKAVEGQLPGASVRLLEALNETVVVLKAMQKSFFMRSNVEEVHKEESQRLPASK